MTTQSLQNNKKSSYWIISNTNALPDLRTYKNYHLTKCLTKKIAKINQGFENLIVIYLKYRYLWCTVTGSVTRDVK